MKIVWSPLAIEQVKDIANYIALDKVPATQSWIEEVFDSVKRLEEFSESGRKVPEIDRENIREIVNGNYRVIYKIENNKVLVLTVKNYRQQLNQEEF